MVHEQPVVRRRRWVRRGVVLGLLVVGYVGFVVVRLFVLQPKLEIGRETTFVDGPVRADGTIDYAAALNAAWSQGVTPENNAAVPLARAFGPGIIAPEIRGEYFRLLGMEVPGEGETYFLRLDDYLERNGVVEERRRELADAYTQVNPGEIANEYPELVAWVERNRGPMERVVEATRRTRYFEPAVSVDASQLLLDAALPSVQHPRDVARLLRVRAMLRTEGGDLEGACEDALACHRFGRLVAGHPTMIGYLVGCAIDASAAAISEALILSGELTPDLAARFRREVDAMPPFPDLADMLDRGERLYSLDMVLHGSALDEAGPATEVVPGSLASSFDPNVLLREVNGYYDAAVEAMRIDDRTERNTRLDQLAKEYGDASRGDRSVGMIASAALLGDSGPLTRHVSRILLSLMSPAMQQMQRAQDRSATRERLCRVGWALAEHPAVEGRFPESLDALRDRFPGGIPVDLYTGEALKYRRVEDGFLLYSAGENGADDGGRSFGECDECDDLRFGADPGGDE